MSWSVWFSTVEIEFGIDCQGLSQTHINYKVINFSYFLTTHKSAAKLLLTIYE